MKFHHHIAHHVRKHKANIVAHVQKHHTKYLAWAGILSWMAIYKIIWMAAIFLGMTYMGWWTIGADYYDAEYYAQQDANKISISTENISDTTWCMITGENLSWVANCTETNK